MGIISKSAGICLGLIGIAGTLNAQGTPGPAAAGALEQVKSDYGSKVLPIFRQSCFACHGPQPQDTDHVADPDAQRRMVKLIKRAKYQFPMVETFPDPGDDDPADSLGRLIKSLKKDAMPPAKSQKLFGMGQPLSAKDKKIILSWAKSSLKIMQPPKKGEGLK